MIAELDGYYQKVPRLPAHRNRKDLVQRNERAGAAIFILAALEQVFTDQDQFPFGQDTCMSWRFDPAEVSIWK